MPTYTSPGINTPVRAGVSGNLCVAYGEITGNGAGAVVAIADVLRLVKIPRQCRIYDVKVWPDTATASLTGSVGVESINGVSGVTDADAFIKAGTSLATIVPAGGNAGDTLPLVTRDEVYITVTTAGAAIALGTKTKCVVIYEYLGEK